MLKGTEQRTGFRAATFCSAALGRVARVNAGRTAVATGDGGGPEYTVRGGLLYTDIMYTGRGAHSTLTGGRSTVCTLTGRSTVH